MLAHQASMLAWIHAPIFVYSLDDLDSHQVVTAFVPFCQCCFAAGGGAKSGQMRGALVMLGAQPPARAGLSLTAQNSATEREAHDGELATAPGGRREHVDNNVPVETLHNLPERTLAKLVDHFVWTRDGSGKLSVSGLRHASTSALQARVWRAARACAARVGYAQGGRGQQRPQSASAHDLEPARPACAGHLLHVLTAAPLFTIAPPVSWAAVPK